MKYTPIYTQKAKNIICKLINSQERYRELFKNTLNTALADPMNLALYRNSENLAYKNKFCKKTYGCTSIVLIMERDDINKRLIIIDIELVVDPNCRVLD